MDIKTEIIALPDKIRTCQLPTNEFIGLNLFGWNAYVQFKSLQWSHKEHSSFEPSNIGMDDSVDHESIFGKLDCSAPTILKLWKNKYK